MTADHKKVININHHLGWLKYFNALDAKDPWTRAEEKIHLDKLENTLFPKAEEVAFCKSCQKYTNDPMDLEFMVKGGSPMCLGCDDRTADFNNDMEYEHAMPSDGEDYMENFC